MGFLQNFSDGRRKFILRRYEHKLVGYQSVIGKVISTVKTVELVQGLVGSVVKHFAPDEESIPSQFKGQIDLENIKRDIRIVSAACSKLEEEIESIRMNEHKWNDTDYIQRLKKKDKNIESSAKSLINIVDKSFRKATLEAL